MIIVLFAFLKQKIIKHHRCCLKVFLPEVECSPSYLKQLGRVSSQKRMWYEEGLLGKETSRVYRIFYGISRVLCGCSMDFLYVFWIFSGISRLLMGALWKKIRMFFVVLMEFMVLYCVLFHGMLTMEFLRSVLWIFNGISRDFQFMDFPNRLFDGSFKVFLMDFLGLVLTMLKGFDGFGVLRGAGWLYFSIVGFCLEGNSKNSFRDHRRVEWRISQFWLNKS